MQFDSDAAPFAKTIATDIHAARKRAGLTLAEVAVAAGVRTATVWQAENNPTRMRLDTLFAIASVLGLTITLRS